MANPSQLSNNGILLSTVVMAVLAAVLLALGYNRGHGEHVKGLTSGLKTLASVLPLLFFVFVSVGMLPLLIPPTTFARWVGAESGMRGIWIGAIFGGIAPGGPFVQAVIAAFLYKSGMAVGPVVAFMTAGMLWGLALLPMEMGILGVRLYAMRVACTFFFPPVAGWIAQLLFGKAGS